MKLKIRNTLGIPFDELEHNKWYQIAPYKHPDYDVSFLGIYVGKWERGEGWDYGVWFSFGRGMNNSYRMACPPDFIDDIEVIEKWYR